MALCGAPDVNGRSKLCEKCNFEVELLTELIINIETNNWWSLVCS